MHAGFVYYKDIFHIPHNVSGRTSDVLRNRVPCGVPAGFLPPVFLRYKLYVHNSGFCFRGVTADTGWPPGNYLPWRMLQPGSDILRQSVTCKYRIRVELRSYRISIVMNWQKYSGSFRKNTGGNHSLGHTIVPSCQILQNHLCFRSFHCKNS